MIDDGFRFSIGEIIGCLCRGIGWQWRNYKMIGKRVKLIALSSYQYNQPHLFFHIK